MKILFVSASSGSRGGGELYLLYLGKELKALGHEIALWCSSHERMDELCDSFKELGRVFRQPYTNTYDYKVRSVRHFLPSSGQKEFDAVCESFKPDLIHLNKQTLEDGLDLLKWVDVAKTPSLTTIHITQVQKDLGGKFSASRDWVSHRMLKRAKQTYVTIAENRFDELKDFIGYNKSIEFVANGVVLPDPKVQAKERKQTRENLSVSEDTPLFVAVARLEPQKNPLLFMDWAHEIQKTLANAQFIWVGDGRMRDEWEQKAVEMGLSESIRCMGWQSDIKPYLSAADAFLHTADFEGLPFAILEAMAFSQIVIAQESLIDELEGKLQNAIVPAGQLTPFCKQMKVEPSLLIEKRVQCRAVIEEFYSSKKMAEEYVDLYEKLLSKA